MSEVAAALPISRFLAHPLVVTLASPCLDVALGPCPHPNATENANGKADADFHGDVLRLVEPSEKWHISGYCGEEG